MQGKVGPSRRPGQAAAAILVRRTEERYNPNPMKRVLICTLGVVVVVAAVGLFLLLNPETGARLFFGVDSSPVEITLRRSYRVPPADEKTAAIVAAATHLLGSLNDNQRQAATYAFTDNAQRSNWSNFPESMVPRGGLRLGALSDSQRANLDNLLAELLSEEGVRNIVHQLTAEETLVPGDRLRLMKYGSQFYCFAFLGAPSTTEPWMFQFGGHHLAINITVFGPNVSFSPMLTGGQPLRVIHEGEEIFITHKEAAAAQAFMGSLTEDQRRLAIRGDQPIGLLLGPGEYGRVVDREGIKGRDLTEAQKELLLGVITARLGFMNDDDFAVKMETVAAEIDDTYFGWWGPQGVLGGGYFRVTGPSLVIEYSPQNGEGPPDHVHSVYRDPGNDYGAAWIGAPE